MTIMRKKTLLLLGAALAIMAVSLLFCGSAQAATYTIKDNPAPQNEYASLGDLFLAAIPWLDGDVIELTKDDNSLTTPFDFTESIMIKSVGGPWTISTSSNAADPLFQMDGAGLTLTLENVNMIGNATALGNGGSAIGFSDNHSHTLIINGTVNIRGGDGDATGNGGHAAYGYPDTELTIVNNGTGVFAGGHGGNADGCGFFDAKLLTVSGSGNLAFSGLAGLQCDDVTIHGGRVTATGTQTGAQMGGNLQIDAGAAFSATGGHRGIRLQGSEISGGGDMTARSTGPIVLPTMGLGTGIYCNNNALTFSLTGNVDISGPLGGIGLVDGTSQLTLQDGPALGKIWVINGTTEKAFTYYDAVLLQQQGLPQTNFFFTGALAGGTYDTDVNIFILPITPAPLPSPDGGGWFIPPKPEKPVPAPTPFPAQGIVTGRRINVYKYETLKTVLFRMNQNDNFTILGLANNGCALYIEKDGRQGYIAIRDIKATFGAPLRGTALKKAGAYNLLESGKYKRVGYFDKEQILWIHGISGKYLINRQTNATYYLDAGQWRLSLSAASGG